MACRGASHELQDHFLDIRKMVDLNSGVIRAIEGIALTRHAYRLFNPNGDPSKYVIALAQTYLAVHTPRQK